MDNDVLDYRVANLGARTRGTHQRPAKMITVLDNDRGYHTGLGLMTCSLRPGIAHTVSPLRAESGPGW